MEPDNWRRHWKFGESGAVILRHRAVPPGHNWTIVAYQGRVTVQVHTNVHDDRENARYLATRIFEAVAIAEAQEFADIIPKET